MNCSRLSRDLSRNTRDVFSAATKTTSFATKTASLCLVLLVLAGNTGWAQDCQNNIGNYIEILRSNQSVQARVNALNQLIPCVQLDIAPTTGQGRERDQKLKMLQEKQVLERFIDVLDEGNNHDGSLDDLRLLILQAIGEMGDAIVSIHQANVLTDQRAKDALDSLDTVLTRAMDKFLRALDSSNSKIREQAAIAIGKMGSEANYVTEDLIRALDNNPINPEVRIAILDALSSIYSKSQGRETTSAEVEALKRMLRHDGNAEVREQAARVLGWMGIEANAAVPDLMQTLKTDEAIVARGAAQALNEIAKDANKPDHKGKAEAIRTRSKLAEIATTLVEALGANIGDSEISSAIISALANMGEAAESAVGPLTDMLKNPDEHSTAKRAIDNVAQSLAKAHVKRSIRGLEKARDEIENTHDDPQAVKAAIEDLKRQRSVVEIVLDWASEHILLSAGASLLSPFVLSPILGIFISLLLLWFRPVWLLKINEKLEPLTEFKLLNINIGIPIRYLFIVGFFNYHRRVLEHWVAKYVDSAREAFPTINSTLADRQLHIPLPVLCKTPEWKEQEFRKFTAQNLQPFFRKNKVRILICGEGGSGKTSLACQLGEWAMQQDKTKRLCEKHPILPVWIEARSDIEVYNGKDPFIGSIRAGLGTLIDASDPVAEELLVNLLRQKRVLVIVDNISELNKVIRDRINPGVLADFPVNCLIVTSRNENELGKERKTTLKPLAIDIKANTVSPFLRDYLKAKGEKFDHGKLLNASQRLASLAGDRKVTPLLAGLYSDLMIATKEKTADDKLPKNIPDLMISYLNKLNQGVGEDKRDDRIVRLAAEAVAWACLKKSYQPRPAKLDDVRDALSAVGDSDFLLNYLEERLLLVERTSSRGDLIKFKLDPVAEYLAGSYLVDHYSGDEKKWSEFLAHAQVIASGPQSIREFLLAVRECALYHGAEEVPAFVPVELNSLANVKADDSEPQPEPEEALGL